MIGDVKVIMILAMTADGIIGDDQGNLPWSNCPEDMKFFKDTTINHKHVIMGRKTLDSIGRLLPERSTYILSKSHDIKPKITLGTNTSYSIFSSMASLKEYIHNLTGDHAIQSVVVAGGKQIYEQFLEYADEVYISNIPKQYYRPLPGNPIDVNDLLTRIHNDSQLTSRGTMRIRLSLDIDTYAFSRK